jgi:hypothetical protein
VCGDRCARVARPSVIAGAIVDDLAGDLAIAAMPGAIVATAIVDDLARDLATAAMSGTARLTRSARRERAMQPTQADVIAQLEDALESAFPPVTIDRAMIDEPTALWHVYDDYTDLAAFEGKTWRELEPELLYRHPMLLVFAGDDLWRTTLPGYLWYLLHERTLFNALPFQVASQLTRKDDPDSHPRFDRRIAPLSPEQRATIRDVLAFLATVSPLEEAMSRAITTWNNL